MKTIIKFLTISTLFFASFGYAVAQSAASSSQQVIERMTQTTQTPVADTTTPNDVPERGIPMPPHIDQMLQDGKISQALKEFDNFKNAQKKANPYNLLYCEMTVYEQAARLEPANNTYAQKAEAIRQELIAKYPNVSDTYLLQIDEDTPDDKIIELATKALELDPSNIGAYVNRGRTLFKLGKIKEACADFEKLPWKGNMPEYWQCKDLK